MTTINKLDCPYEVKVEFVDTDDLNTITPKNEGEITIDAELHKESFVAITNYEDLIVEAPRLCSVCDGIFPNSYSFLQHNLQHLKLKLDKCDEYSCKTCSGKFSTHHDLENHKGNCVLYDNNNKSICPICKEHIESTKLRSHLRTHPNKEAKCDICGVIIKSLSNFRHHMQNIHNRQFKNCEYCGKSIRLFYYSVHIKKVHSHEKVKCDLCCKYFNSVENMERHKLYIHEKLKTKQTQDLKYKCFMCSHAFKLERNLIAHVEKCKPLKCGLCDSIFKNKPNLRNHLTWVHYSGKGHSCEICGKTFKSPYSLRKHMKTSHSADKQER